MSDFLVSVLMVVVLISVVVLIFAVPIGIGKAVDYIQARAKRAQRAQGTRVRMSSLEWKSYIENLEYRIAIEKGWKY